MLYWTFKSFFEWTFWRNPTEQNNYDWNLYSFSFTFLWNIFTWYSIWIGFLHTTDMNLVKSTQIRIRDNLTVGIFNHLQPSICFYLFLSVLSVLSVFISFLLVFYLFSIYFYLLSTIFNCFNLFLICFYLLLSASICFYLFKFVRRSYWWTD